MTMTPGTRLGPYEVISPLGAGGMGEVWRGRDTRLNRDVAIKILPDGFASNEQFRARFEREARTISSLNHPNICTLFDVGHEGATHFLIMELIEGESLAERLAKGPLPPDQVLKTGSQVADALDRAHKQGIVHRDLKPGNVMLTKTGAKLLDFGLARSGTDSSPVQGLTEMPTQAKPLTQEGTILGTFQYMAPEQLEGIEADARTDIFAFGALLYEMATGRRAFEGTSKTSLIAAIVSSQPPPISSLTPMTPPALDHIVRKCLEKDPDDRWQSAHDVAGELRWVSEAGSQAGVATAITVRRRSRERLAWVLAGLLAIIAAALAAGFVRRAPVAAPPFRATLMPPPDTALIPFDVLGLSLSADGSQLAFVSNSSDGSRQIWIRNLGELTAHAVPETRGGSYPFWSPDGRYLGFFADGKLKKVDLRGGSPQVLADAPSGRGASWSAGDVIIFSPKIRSAILSIPAAGGTPKPVTHFDEKKETTHRWPQFLPDGRHFFYISRVPREGGRDAGCLLLASLDSPAVTTLIDDATNAMFVAPGYLLYGRAASLYAWRFDPAKLRLTGKPIPFNDQKLSYWEPKNFIPFSAAGNGTIVYLPDASRKSTLEWYSRDGRPLGRLAPPGFYGAPRVSGDGRKVAFFQVDPESNVGDLWIADLEYDRRFRFTQKSGRYSSPEWSHDSKRLAFVCSPKTVQDLCIKSLVDGSDVELLYESPSWKTDGSWMPDDKAILFSEQDPETNEDLKLLPLEGKREPRLILRTPFNEQTPQASLDGKWIAYASDETGRGEIYIRASSGAYQQWQLSSGGGSQPRWRGDGKELFYLAPDGNVMSAAIEVAPVFRPATPKVLFKLPQPPDRDTPVFEDITPDGQRVLLNVPVTERSSVGFHVILNWTSLLRDQ